RNLPRASRSAISRRSNMLRNPLLAIAAAAAVLFAARGFAHLDGSYIVPLDDPAINYADHTLDDPVTRLQQRLDRGEVKLAYDPKFGYLPSVLRNLGAPVSSQILVFSRTSFQAARIYPRAPRALYFTDDVSVGFVRNGDVVELAAADPTHGAVFFTLDQKDTKS